MKSYKELLTEMLKPLDAHYMCRILMSKFHFTDLQTRIKHNSVDEIELLTNDDEHAKELFFSDDNEQNQKNIKILDKFLNKYHWYVNQVNANYEAILLQQRDVNDFSTTSTSDPANFKDGEEDLDVVTSNIKEYGFIHVSKAPPEIVAKTGLRAKSSQTFDKHDERRIYLFSLAPQFVTTRENIVQKLEQGDLYSLTKLLSDCGSQLMMNVLAFAKERGAKYVYLIKRLQKPAKLYKDNAWTDFNHRDAIYTKDYNILPQDIVYLCTVSDLYTKTRVAGLMKDLSTTSELSTAVDRIDLEGETFEDRYNINLNDDYKQYVDELYKDNLYLRRIINLASKLLAAEYNVKMEPTEVLYELARKKDVLDYVEEKSNEIEEKITNIRDTYGDSIAASQRIRKVYTNFADFIMATVLEMIDYKNNKKNYR